ncbi:MAG: sigma 54-interacting transcriptional regulator [Deltaproteobacteria bacterium]|nr:sigma 54-interacting transcriptional regulator [Deltaproteobacteria bacterium]
MAQRLSRSRYRLVRRIGSGSDADVFLALDTERGDAPRALKVIRGASDAAARDRLMGEFLRLASLSHPRLVRVYDLEVATSQDFLPPGTLFFTGDHVDGRSPADVLRELPEESRPRALCDLAVDVASALAHVHARGLVHHDVKPANLLITSQGHAMLLDLGLAAARATLGAPRGTLLTMAPEALAGTSDPRVDLYALGATLYTLACGRPPFDAPDPGSLAHAILHAPLVPPSVLAPYLPEPLANLVVRLLSRRPEVRPSSAPMLLEELARVREACGWGGPIMDEGADQADTRFPATLLPPPLVGREQQLATLDDVVLSLAGGHPQAQVVRIVGATGMGKSRLVTEAIARHQVRVAEGRAAAIRVVHGGWEEVVSAVGEPSAEVAAHGMQDAEAGARMGVRVAEHVASALVELGRTSPTLACLEDADLDDRSQALVALAEAGGLQGGACALIVTTGEEPKGGLLSDGTLALTLPSLSPSQVADLAAAMVGRCVDSAWTAALARHAGGNPGLCVEAIREAAARGGVGAIERVPARELLGDDGLAALLHQRMASQPQAARAIMEVVAVWGMPADVTDVACLTGVAPAEAWASIADLAASGLIILHGTLPAQRVALPSLVHEDLILKGIPSDRRLELHRAALARLDTKGEKDPRLLVRHLLSCGQPSDIAAAALAAARATRVDGDLRGAWSFLQQGLPHAGGDTRNEVLVELAEVGIVLCRYDEAASAAGQVEQEGPWQRRAQLLLARALSRQGHFDAAARLLEQLCRASPEDEEAQGALARLRVGKGEHEQALAIAGSPEEEEPTRGALSPGRALRLEAAGLAAMYLGDGTRAEHAFARLRQAAEATGDRVLLGRSMGLLGLLAQRHGDVVQAADRYGEALAHARGAGDLHGASVYAMNRASALAERGFFAEVLSATADAISGLRRLGRVGELAGAYYNRGIALLALGEISAARHASIRALSEAESRGLPQLLALAHLLSGDISRREGNLGVALQAYERATRVLSSVGSMRALAEINRAEALAELGRQEEAEIALREASAACQDADERDRVALTAARVVLSCGGPVEGALSQLLPAARRLRETGRLDLAWRADLCAARLHVMAGDVRAASELARRARATWDELKDRAPESRRAHLSTDPDACALDALDCRLVPPVPTSRAVEAGTRSSAALQRLRRLVLLGKRLNAELRLGPLLEDIIDAVIEATCAERGFLLLRKDGVLEVTVARNIDQVALSGTDLAVSRSIAERAARTGEPVVTVDAAMDERFGSAASVGALKLRSVLAVPLCVKGQVVGTIYVDHRFRTAAFDEEAVELVMDLADIAAIALHNARLVEENERRREEVAELGRRLQEEVERQRAELDSARATLRSSAALELKYRYDALVGRSPRMVELLRLVDRATETSLPVVIHGESGTGKELVARALHQNSARRDQPLVTVNCAAVPETLLEDELFGHVRGAFTGADRDRKGLFEVADGGTLFLDEIGDTSLAMQAKLLRVLQDGEIRRLGSERSRAVDVRITCATHRDLRQLVETGRFREDLFYRLNVIPIHIPPLRERTEDIPALVEHFLDRMASRGMPKKTVDRRALARLLAYPWPGNVRELENEILRAAALGGAVITLSDLSPRVATEGPEKHGSQNDELSLKPRVEMLERTLLRQALAKSGGNQTVAAKLLGLSRFGLQKKLKRYELS